MINNLSILTDFLGIVTIKFSICSEFYQAALPKNKNLNSLHDGFVVILTN